MLPIQRTSLIIKHDKPNDDELRLLTAQLQEQQKKPAPVPKQKIHVQLQPTTTGSGNNIVEQSISGRFGWAELAPGKPVLQKTNLKVIPYFYRQSKKYCSFRMFQLKLRDFHMHPDIGKCIPHLRKYKICDPEIGLLNEINFRHCDGQFGAQFNRNDMVLSLEDALGCYQFLAECHRMLISSIPGSVPRKCGWIRFNGGSVVSFVVMNGQCLLPLFCIAKAPKEWTAKKQEVRGWELAYLKFCCRVQGIISADIWTQDCMPVIPLDDIMHLQMERPAIEYYWPSLDVTLEFLGGYARNLARSQT